MAQLSVTQGLDGRTIRQLLSRWFGETPRVSPMKSRRAKGLPAHRGLNQFHQGPGGSGLKRRRTSVPKSIAIDEKTRFSGNHGNRLTAFRNKEAAAWIQGRGCIPTPKARALLGTPPGGCYPDPGYQHEGHHRLSLHKRDQFETAPELKFETRINPGGLSSMDPATGTKQPGNEDSRGPEGRYGMNTEKA